MTREFYIFSNDDMRDLNDFVNANRDKLFKISFEGDTAFIETYEDELNG